ncbi:MAG: sigma-70 family RNA polymerase sigma factor [Clostridia bacterium]|nr:sigma-70 family RNA polymerase sigma factor [Clostridia bacterium]
MEEQKIIELYFARKEQAIRETEAGYGKLCYGIAYRILGNREDAEECVNDTYAALWRAIPPEKPQNFKAYVCKVTRNLALKKAEYLHREKRSAGLSVSFEELEGVLCDGGISPETGDEELGRAIGRFLKTEKEEARKVFVRRYFFFDSIGEIGKRYGFSDSKVKNMLLRTRKRLQAFLRKEGFDL